MTDDLILRTADVRRDARSNRITKLRGHFPLQQDDAGRPLEDRVKSFLTAHADDLQLAAKSDDLKIIQNAATPTRRILRFQQTRDGIPIDRATVLVQLDLQDNIRQVDLAQDSRIPVGAPQGDGSQISPEEALQAAINDVRGANLRMKPEPGRKIYFPLGDTLRPAYEVLVCTAQPPHDWRYIIDAFTGAVLFREDLLKEVNGTGLVFDPNPVVTGATNTLRDPDATGSCGFVPSLRVTLDAQRVTRTLQDITLAGGVHKLEGPFCKMQNFGPPNIAPPQEANANDFQYGSGDNRFDDVNVYYHVDTIQRYIQSLGITNANNRQTPCDAHDGAGGGAFYSPADTGLHFGDSGSCQPDRAEDGDVMLHEYGHAIQDNQVPGWGGTNPGTGRNETGAMGEGFGDFLACSFFAPDHNVFQRECFEDWIFSVNGAAGLRRVDGTKVYPTNWAHQVHADGEIWSAALWNIYRTIGGDSPVLATRRAARDALVKTVILSHFSVLENGTMPDGAEAVMETNAELNDFLGRHLMQMLDSFHARGILPCSPSADLWIREAVGDPGANNYVGPVFWDSPDLWIRNSNDGGTTHQNPEFGQDNWFYARVRNRGTATARAFVVTFNIKPWAGVQFSYPNDWVPYISAAVGFNLAPGASTVVRAKWPAALVPATSVHACWLAQVYTPVDPTAAGSHVWESNNLAQKNLTIVDLAPNDSTVIQFQVGNLNNVVAGRYRLEINRPANWTSLPVSISHPDPAVTKALFHSIEEIPITVTTPVLTAKPSRVIRFLEPAKVEIAHRGLAAEPVTLRLGQDSSVDLDRVDDSFGVAADFDAASRQANLVADEAGNTAIALAPGVLSGFPIALPARSQTEFGMKIAVPPEAKPGDEIKIHLVQRDDRKQVVGGITVQINVRRK